MKLFRSVPPDCPKCGRTTNTAAGEPSWANGPNYNADEDVLTWRCRECHFLFSTPTRDALTRSNDMLEALTEGLPKKDGDDEADEP